MYLYGASGHAKVIIDILKSSDVAISGLFDDNPKLTALDGVPVLGAYNKQVLDAPMIISIGNNSTRARLARELGLCFGNAIHPSAIIASSVSIGEGTVVMHGAILQADTRVGAHAIINTAARIDHDCVIGDYAHISPGAVLSGNVTVGEGTHVGSGAVVIQVIKIGKWCKVGAGTIVIRDIPDGVTVVGNPARIIKRNG